MEENDGRLTFLQEVGCVLTFIGREILVPIFLAIFYIKKKIK